MGNPNLTKDLIKQAIKEWEEQHAYPPEIHFNRHRLPPSGWEYIGPDDHLQVTVFTTAATTGLTLAYRTLTSDGRVHYAQESIDTSTLSTVITSRFKLAEGWLIGVTASNIGGGLADQTCFVVLALQRTFKSGTVPHTILQQGYVTNVISVSWPPVFARGPAPSTTPSGLVQIAQTILAAPAASVTFSSVPGIYSALLLLAVCRASDAATQENVLLQVNGDTGANYDFSNVQAAGNSASAVSSAAQTSSFVGRTSGNTATANTLGQLAIQFVNYAGTGINKSWVSNYGCVNVQGTVTGYVSGQSFSHWRNTGAITQITLFDQGGGNFVAPSTFTLYGEK